MYPGGLFYPSAESGVRFVKVCPEERALQRFQTDTVIDLYARVNMPVLELLRRGVGTHKSRTIEYW